MNILVTGAGGFVGRNLVENLKNIRDGKNRTRPALSIENIYEYDKENPPEDLDRFCADCDFVFHLAGVNRPEDPAEFRAGNFGFSSVLLETLKKHENRCPVMLSSSVQATLAGRFGNSEYGRSKKAGEELFFAYAKETGAEVFVYRFPNLAGKWVRPNYNSAVGTFCYNIAHDQPIRIDDPNVELEILFIDDLIEEMLDAMEGKAHPCVYPAAGEVRNGITFDGLTPCYLSEEEKATLSDSCSSGYLSEAGQSVLSNDPTPNDRSAAEQSAPSNEPTPSDRSESEQSVPSDNLTPSDLSKAEQSTPSNDPSPRFYGAPVTHKATLGYIAECLYTFRDQPKHLRMPRIAEGSFEKKLYSMYLSYLPEEKVIYDLDMKTDERGSFTELLKTADHGQFSVNISKPGITKGQHWHNSKWELFIVVSGHGLIRERKIGTDPETGKPYEPMEFEVSGEKIRAVHMLPGYTHSIINLSETEDLVTLMWANEIFDPDRPDTFFEPV